MKDKKGKVLIIGLDGATFDLIKPWVDKGRLPCLAHLMKNGVWGNLRSVVPSVSGPAWVSFMTGKNPGKHGILGFTTLTDQDEEQAQLISSLHVKDETLWQVLSSHGKRVGVMNVPLTYPPRKVNGFLISGFMTPPSASGFTYPEELKHSIPEYRIGLRQGRQRESGDRLNMKSENKLSIIEEYHDIAERRTAAAVKLITQWDSDFFMVVFKGTDDMQHFFWGREDILLEYYRKIDKSIERILAAGGRDNNVLIISDHGFGPAATRRFYTSTWLEELGLLKIKQGVKNSVLRSVYHLVRDLKRRIGIRKRLPSGSVASVNKAVTTSIAWHQSKAYSRKLSGIAAININLRGREPQGIVEPGHDYEELREEVIKRLRSLKDPKTGEMVMSEIYKNNEKYWGPNLNKVPDIIGVPNPRYHVNSGLLNTSILSDYSRRNPGHHHAQANGILIASGPDIKAGQKVEDARLYDIAPTVLHMMGLLVPRDMDGTVLNELFREDSEPAQRAVKYEGVSPERKRVVDRVARLKIRGKA